VSYKCYGKPLNELKFETVSVLKRKRQDIIVNDIMCFDTETTSGFINPNTKEVEMYDYNLYSEIKDKEKRTQAKQNYYSECEKVSLCYLWIFSINRNVYMGRTLESFVEFMIELDNIIPYKKIVYVHNLSFDFVQLQNVLDFENVFSTDKHKIVYAKCGSFEFRCSFLLTGFSLDKWGTEKKLPVQKLTGEIDYNIMRTPNTPLESSIIDYAKNDVLTMYYGLQEYRKKYGNLENIPLTKTGETRRQVQALAEKDVNFNKMCADLIPVNIEDYKLLTSVFFGGYTHANSAHVNRVLKGLDGYDIASSYPYVMCVEKFPSTPFVKTLPVDTYFNNDKYSYIIEFTCINLHSKRWNTFLSFGKALEISHYSCDNGRIIKADYIRYRLTNIDYEIFKQCYTYDNLQIIDFRVSINKYLPKWYVLFILEKYKEKTELKGIPEHYDSYFNSKTVINGIFGMNVTKAPFDDTYIFSNDLWIEDKLTEEKYNKEVKKKKRQLRKCFTWYSLGCYITAYARRNLWRGILGNTGGINNDFSVVYCDTDSIKMLQNGTKFFDEYNKEVMERENKRALELGIDPKLFSPVDKFGNEHRLGVYDYEEYYSEFKTLGCKRYIGRIDGELKMTVAGVRKKAVYALKDDINNFTNRFIFDEDESQKLLSFYRDDMTPVTWCKGKKDEYYSTQKFGICLQPTTYELSINPVFALQALLNNWKITEVLKNETKIL
jgi:hypothetical protein